MLMVSCWYDASSSDSELIIMIRRKKRPLQCVCTAVYVHVFLWLFTHGTCLLDGGLGADVAPKRPVFRGEGATATFEVQIMSDLHLEFPNALANLAPPTLYPAPRSFTF
jgi:hypothetical protein